MKIPPTIWKWVIVASMVILSASVITTPLDLKSMLPEWATKILIGNFSLVSISAYLVLIGAFIVANNKKYLP
jgi:Ni,Fe-hydrogenase I cytochrome b subunit